MLLRLWLRSWPRRRTRPHSLRPAAVLRLRLWLRLRLSLLPSLPSAALVVLPRRCLRLRRWLRLRLRLPPRATAVVLLRLWLSLWLTLWLRLSPALPPAATIVLLLRLRLRLRLCGSRRLLLTILLPPGSNAAWQLPLRGGWR